MPVANRPALKRGLLLFFRYVFPGVLVAFGVLYALIDRSESGLEAFSLFVGAGLSIVLLNFLYRMGVSGDSDRDAEDQAREYFSQHGRWPDERD